MINYMNQSGNDTKFLFITPYLTEVERIISSCPDKQFKQPDVYGTKLNGIKHLMEHGENIVSTHKLFSLFTRDMAALIRQHRYVLVLDEVIDVVEPFTLSSDDFDLILENCARADSGDILHWYKDDYSGVFDDIKRSCDTGSVRMYGERAFLRLLPIEMFKVFERVYILTYMFNAQIQRYYYDYHKIKYSYLHVQGTAPENYELTPVSVKTPPSDFNRLIRICEREKLNRIGDTRTALSKSWYAQNADAPGMRQLRNNTTNFFKNITRTESNMNLWTTFKDYQEHLQYKGYVKGFLSLNARATNEYRERTSVAYLANRFMNPLVRNFFVMNGVEVDEDEYALSEMLQFIWRSAIRDGKAIDVYIPSSRMRGLLEQWIAGRN